VLLLVPVQPYWVEYKVASRRLYFELDVLLLRAIGEESIRTIERLESEFRTSRQLLIESLLQLFDDGWLALPYDGLGGFSLTRKGRRWLESGKQELLNAAPPVKRTATILQELVTGGLVRRDEAYVLSRYELEKQAKEATTVTLPTEVSVDDLDDGRTYRLLSCDAGEWVYSIDDVRPRGGTLYLPVDYSDENQRFTGLPAPWQARLAPVLVEKARQTLGISADSDALARMTCVGTGSSYTIPFVQRNLILGNLAIGTRLKQVFDAARAGSRVLICLSALGNGIWDELRDCLETIAFRNVTVNLLWNSAPGQDELVRRIRELLESIGRQLRGDTQLVWNHLPLPIRSDLLMVVRNDNQVELGIGPGSWIVNALSFPQDDLRSLALTLQHPALGAEACRSVAGMLDAHQQGRYFPTPSPAPWRAVAMELETATQLLDTRAEVFPGESQLVEASLVRDVDRGASLNHLVSEDNGPFLFSVGSLSDDLVNRLSMTRRIFAAPDAQFKILHVDGTAPTNEVAGFEFGLESDGLPGVVITSSSISFGRLNPLSSPVPRKPELDLGVAIRWPSGAKLVREYMSSSVRLKPSFE
jgi:hypothetical protein